MSCPDERRADDRASGKWLIPGEPGAVKVACPVRKGGWGNTVWLCALLLPYDGAEERTAGINHLPPDSPCLHDTAFSYLPLVLSLDDPLAMPYD
jgi:hypothetical protein